MSYQPYDRTPSGIVFFGNSPSDQVFESSSNFIYNTGTDTLEVSNITVLSGLNVNGNEVVNGNLTVYGNLNISGTVNQIDIQQLLVEDNTIILNSNYSGLTEPISDASIYIERGPSYSGVEIRWDEGDNLWEFTNDGVNYYPLSIAGSGLSYRVGSGPSSFGSIVDLDLNDLPSVTGAQDSDYIAIVDTSDSNKTKKITRSNLLTGLGAGTVTSVNVSSDTIIISGSPITSTGTIDLEVKVDNSTIEHNPSGQLTIKNSGINFIHLSNGLVITSGEAFSDTNDTLMTSAAIADKIESYGYTNNSGTIISVIGGSGLSAVTGVGSDTITLNIKVDDVTIGIGTGLIDDKIYVKDGGIDTVQLANGSVIESKISRTVNTYTTNSNISHDIALGSGVITLTLPSASSVTGKMVYIKRIDANAGALTIVTSTGTQTIDGAASKILYYQYEALNVVSNGNNWFII